MFYGVQITSDIQDWQVFQRREGRAIVAIEGRWRLEDGAVRAGVSSATPLLRLVNEQDQSCVLPWRKCDWQSGGENLTAEEVAGEWKATVALPQGGPYRLETSLDAVSRESGEHWMFRGDIRVHLGVGDVFCIAGQSNAAGYARGTAFDPPDPRVRLKRNSGKWDMAAHPMNDATGAADCPNAPMGITGASPFLSFGRRYADYTGLPVGLIQTAQGGSPMKRWDEARDGDLYRNMIRRLGPDFDARAVMWYQGCSDADAENAALYRESFERMVDSTRRAAGWPVPFFTMQLNRYENQPDADGWARIKEIQRRAAEEMENVYLMPTAGLPLSDEIHNSASANVALGEALARQVHGALNGGAPYEAPALETARWEGNFIRLTFRRADDLARLRPRHDMGDFCLTDDMGDAPIGDLSVRGRDVLVTPARPLEGRALISYGCDPQGPVGLIVDQNTYLPIISFYRVEVSR